MIEYWSMIKRYCKRYTGKLRIEWELQWTIVSFRSCVICRLQRSCSLHQASSSAKPKSEECIYIQHVLPKEAQRVTKRNVTQCLNCEHTHAFKLFMRERIWSTSIILRKGLLFVSCDSALVKVCLEGGDILFNIHLDIFPLVGIKIFDVGRVKNIYLQ